MESQTPPPVVVEIGGIYEITTFSRYFGLALFIIMPFLGGWVGYRQAPEKVVEVERVVAVSAARDVQNVAQSIALGNDELEWTMPAGTDVPGEYASSGYRVVGVVYNPYYSEESKYDSLVIVAPRGVNDHTCGGLYVPDTCYLFFESSYANIETPKFMGMWNKGPLKQETVKFVAPTVIEFEIGLGDAGVSYEATWRLDVVTGSSSKVSQKQTSSLE